MTVRNGTATSRRRGGTLALSWGAWGGVYLHRHRLCLGWLAITYCPVELDDLMEAYVAWHGKPSSETIERGHVALCRFVFPGHFVPREDMARAVLTAATDPRPDWTERLPEKRIIREGRPG